MYCTPEKCRWHKANWKKRCPHPIHTRPAWFSGKRMWPAQQPLSVPRQPPITIRPIGERCFPLSFFLSLTGVLRLPACHVGQFPCSGHDLRQSRPAWLRSADPSDSGESPVRNRSDRQVLLYAIGSSPGRRHGKVNQQNRLVKEIQNEENQTEKPGSGNGYAVMAVSFPWVVGFPCHCPPI